MRLLMDRFTWKPEPLHIFGMDDVALAIVGSSLLGAGANLFGASQQASAAEEAALAQNQLASQGQAAIADATTRGLEATQPYRDIGLAAYTRLSQLLGVPLPTGTADPLAAQRARLEDAYRTALAQETALGDSIRNGTFPLLSGPYASERRQQLFEAQAQPLRAATQRAKAALDTFNARNPPGTAPTVPAANLSGSPAFQFTPIYDYQRAIGLRNLLRSQSARGLIGSGAGLEQEMVLDQALQAEDVNRQLSALLQASNIGAQAGSGQSQILGASGGQLANLLTQNAIFQGAGITNAAAARAGAAAGIANQVNSAAGLYLQNQQFNMLADLIRSPSQNSLNVQNVPTGGRLTTGVSAFASPYLN